MCNLRLIVISLCVLVPGMLSCAQDVYMGDMPANKILFLGNSITFCPQPDSEDWWGLSASDPEHDYAHLLTGKINNATGGNLTLVPPDPLQPRWEPGDPTPNYTGNILNVADIFERSFDTWDNNRIQNQLDYQPDIVIVQLGENLDWEGRTLEQFRTGLDTMLTGLKNSSNPNIFVTGYILGAYPAVDAIKQELCDEDPAHRVFVDLSVIGQNPAAYIGAYDHPNDQGMAVIADEIFYAMETHSTPEPATLCLLGLGFSSVLLRKKRR